MAALSRRCCICGSTGHSLRRCLAPFKNGFSLLNPEFATHGADGSIFETWKEKMRFRRRRGSDCRRQGNGRRNASGNSNSRSHYQGNSSGPPSCGTLRRSRASTSRALEPLWPCPPLHPPLSCGMALRSRVTPTRTRADQVRFRCRLHLLHDGSKTVPHP